MEEKQLQNAKNAYRQLISKLKILSIRAQYNGNKLEDEHYKNIYKKLEKLQEEIHLPLIGEQTEAKTTYNEILELLATTNEQIQQVEDDNQINNMINNVEQICEKHNINYKEIERL